MAWGPSSGTRAKDDEPVRALKSARVAVAVPKKKNPLSNLLVAKSYPRPTLTKSVQAGQLPTIRSSSQHVAFQAYEWYHSHTSATFNLTVPTQALTYTALRVPRREESMLSVIGSRVVNPCALGLGWFAGGGEGDEEVNTLKGLVPFKYKGTNREKSDRNADRTQERQHHCHTWRPVWCTCWVVTTFKSLSTVALAQKALPSFLE